MILQGTETLTSLIHIISESLLTPVILILIIFLVIVILSLGSFINEAISRKPIDSKELEKLIREISLSKPNDIKGIINNSNLFIYQKDILIKIANNHDIGIDARKALASKLIGEEELNLIKNTSKTDVLIRLAPILGLLGTLIPLGPGLAALGSGDIATLAESLIIAFDTTVLGLSIGAIAYLISKFKKQWYENDVSTVEAIAEAELESLNDGDFNA
ncbi:MAG: MotA/TolQ/ExbB proton channel family protein [Methanobacteriaceae archaeon]|jgi:biopolymer transport protein ExbB/TolQ|nr:MotA/TolQ/ExbB proton channel family protein [Methanobacteriaceae archaeon]